MPHIIEYTEEIEEHGWCQQQPALTTGDKYLHEVDGKKRLRIVLSVHFDRYVWEDVAQWTTTILEYLEEEYMLFTLPIISDKSNKEEITVFVANSLIGILTCDKDHVCGTLVIPNHIGDTDIRGVAPFGFYNCQHLNKVNFTHFVVIAYEYAFANSGVSEFFCGYGMPVMLHSTAIDGCKNLPSPNTLADTLSETSAFRNFILLSGKSFRKQEEELYRMHFLTHLAVVSDTD